MGGVVPSGWFPVRPMFRGAEHLHRERRPVASIPNGTERDVAAPPGFGPGAVAAARPGRPSPSNRRDRRTAVYMAAVITSGIAMMVLGIVGPFEMRRSLSEPGFWMLCSFALVGELRPVSVRWGTQEQVFSLSTPFVFASLLAYGVGPSFITLLIAVVVVDAVARCHPVKIAFNCAGTVIALGAAGAILHAAAPDDLGTVNVVAGRYAPAIVLASFALFAVNMTLTSAYVALKQGMVVVRHLRRSVTINLVTTLAQLAFGPLVALSILTRPWLVALVLVPLFAVFKGAEAVSKVEFQAMHDSLTGLPNRAFLRDRVEEAIEAASEAHGSSPTGRVAILLCDLDGFKEVNDTLGHHVGDELLKEVGTRLQQALGDNVNVSRLGGDEFALSVQVHDLDEATVIAARLQEALDQPFVFGAARLNVETSIGIATFPDHATDFDTLLQKADVAMYRAKAHHTGVEVYDPANDRNSQAKLNLLGELRDAIPNNELVLYYQPKIDLATNEIVGVEALVRWNHPERGFTPPDDFIPLAERTGLINPLTDWVVEAALAQSHAWRGQGLDLGVAVNISVRCLYDRSFPERVADALARWMVPASSLKLEITEGMLMADPRRAMPVLAELEKMGLSLALDDFGTGYSSLAYLKRLPVAELKIDKSFVMHMTEDQADSTIVRTTIDMARNLGLHVVAEGVENQEALDLLVLFGCNLAQGYHISRPLPVDKADVFLTESGLLVPRLAPRIPDVAWPVQTVPPVVAAAEARTLIRPLQFTT